MGGVVSEAPSLSSWASHAEAPHWPTNQGQDSRAGHVKVTLTLRPKMGEVVSEAPRFFS
jgi:hypothetical protein